jgi:hypothetical protein
MVMAAHPRRGFGCGSTASCPAPCCHREGSPRARAQASSSSRDGIDSSFRLVSWIDDCDKIQVHLQASNATSAAGNGGDELVGASSARSLSSMRPCALQPCSLLSITSSRPSTLSPQGPEGFEGPGGFTTSFSTSRIGMGASLKYYGVKWSSVHMKKKY